MILTKPAILNEIKKKRLKITPFSKTLLSAGAVTLRLSDRIRIYHKTAKIVLNDSVDEKKYSKTVSIKKGYELKPGELVLGLTKEKLTLPDDIVGWLQCRSRMARLGLMIHISSNFIQPGCNNHQILELYNAGPHTLVLKPNQKICKVVFERTEGHAHYSGRYKNQQKL